MKNTLENKSDNEIANRVFRAFSHMLHWKERRLLNAEFAKRFPGMFTTFAADKKKAALPMDCHRPDEGTAEIDWNQWPY